MITGIRSCTSRTMGFNTDFSLNIQRLKNHCRAGATGVASPHNLPSGNVDMKTDVLNKKPEPAEMVWAFDLGKGSIGSPGGVALVDEFPGVAGVTPRGEAVRRGNAFLHKASLLIPAEFTLPR